VPATLHSAAALTQAAASVRFCSTKPRPLRLCISRHGCARVYGKPIIDSELIERGLRRLARRVPELRMDAKQTGLIPRFTLGRKLLIVILTFTGLFLANFLAYNYLLHELDRTATAVDAAGRQRMLSQKIAYLAFQVAAGHKNDRNSLKELTAEFDETLRAFEYGGFSRDFFVARAPADMAPLVQAEDAAWQGYREAARTIESSPAGGAAMKSALGYIETHSEALLAACDAVTAGFRKKAEDATRRMNQLLLLLIGLELLFGAAVFYFTKKRVTEPLVALDSAAAQITAGNFPELENGGSDDEVGNLYKTFSTMAKTISRDIEKRSAISSLLVISMEHGSLPELLGKFLDSLLAIPWLALESKGAVFLAEAGSKNLVMTARRGLSEEILSTCANVQFGRCLCGKTAASGEPVFTAGLDERHEISYIGMKPHGHYCLPIKIRENVIGVLILYLLPGHKYNESEMAFLEAACAIMAKAIDYKNLEAKSYQAQKLESLGRAAGAMAHDFNNILTAMKGFNELALETLPAGGDAHRFVKETAAGIGKGADLVKQILAFSRKQPAEMAALDLNAAITGMQTMLGMVLERKIRLKLNLAPGLPAILGNKGQLEQVIVNLAVNARDAMLPKGGEFTIATSAVSDADAESRAKAPGGTASSVKLTVADTGGGMPPEVIKHIFEPFFTTKPEGQGTGLGLATVYSIVQLHKGSITINSVPGQGTAFELRFPAAPNQATSISRS